MLPEPRLYLGIGRLLLFRVVATDPPSVKSEKGKGEGVPPGRVIFIPFSSPMSELGTARGSRAVRVFLSPSASPLAARYGRQGRGLQPPAAIGSWGAAAAS